MKAIDEQHIRDMIPSRKNDIYIHMTIMGNKAWKHIRGTGDNRYEYVTFSAEEPKIKGTNFYELSYEELNYHTMIISDVPNYFGSLDESWKLVEKLKIEKKYFDIRINTWPDECQVTLLEEYNEWMISCRTLHEAIVKCALIAHMRGGSKE